MTRIVATEFRHTASLMPALTACPVKHSRSRHGLLAQGVAVCCSVKRIAAACLDRIFGKVLYHIQGLVDFPMFVRHFFQSGAVLACATCRTSIPARCREANATAMNTRARARDYEHQLFSNLVSSVCRASWRASGDLDTSCKRRSAEFDSVCTSADGNARRCTLVCRFASVE